MRLFMAVTAFQPPLTTVTKRGVLACAGARSRLGRTSAASVRLEGVELARAALACHWPRKRSSGRAAFWERATVDGGDHRGPHARQVQQQCPVRGTPYLVHGARQRGADRQLRIAYTGASIALTHSAALACATAAVHRLTIPAGSGQVPHAALRSTGTSVRAYPWNGDADMFRRRSMDAVTHRVRVAHQPTIIGHFSLFPSVTAYSATPHVSWRVLAVLDTGLRVWDSRSLNRSRRYCVIACSWVHKRVRPGT